MEVTPTFYKRDGKAIVGDPVLVQSGEIRYVDIKTLIPEPLRRERDWGGMSLSYYGSNREMWSQFRFMNVNGGSSVDEFFTVKDEPRSDIQEAAWWMPRKSSVIIALGNITDAPTSAVITFGDGDTRTVTLAPRATEIVRREHAKTEGSESVTINTTGMAGSIIPTGIIASKDGSFNSVIRFYDTKSTKQPKLFANGFRLAGVTPHMILKNTSASPITAQPKFTALGGVAAADPVTLPDVNLAPGETTEVDLSTLVQAVRRRHDLDVVSVQVTNSGEPGSLIGSLYGISNTKGVSYDTPLRDSGPIRSMTGAYPWKITKDFKTIVYITNITDQEREFVAQLNYEGGKFIIGKRKLKPGETATFDPEKIRDEQVKDSEGQSLSKTVSVGQFYWAQHGGTGGQIVLIGRAEMVSRSQQISTSYSCPMDCGLSYDVWVDPFPFPIFYNSSWGATTWEFGYSNAGYSVGPYKAGADWSTSNPIVSFSAATSSAYNVTITGTGAGYTNLTGYVGSYERYDFDGLNCVDLGPVQEVVYAPEEVIPQVTVSEVGFTGDYPMKRWSNDTAIDSPDGSTPTWKSTSNPNDPVAYAKGSNPTMFAKLAINPSAPNMSASIIVTSGETQIATKDITISGTSTTVTGITTTSATETTVKTTTPTFDWVISVDNSDWQSMGSSGPHTIYWTYAAPLTPPFKNDAGATYSGLYDLALQKACGYANGSSNLGTIIGNLNTGVDSEINYQPSTSIGGQHPLNAYSTTGGCQCSDLANLLRGLLRSIGIDGTTLYIWAGPDSSTIRRFTVGSTASQNPSFRIIRGSHDSAPVNPHFKFHSVVSTNGTWYDPSYGLTYSSLSFDETANNSTAQQIHSTAWTSDSLSSFVCPH